MAMSGVSIADFTGRRKDFTALLTAPLSPAPGNLVLFPNAAAIDFVFFEVDFRQVDVEAVG